MSIEGQSEVLFTLRAIERQRTLLTAQSGDGRVALVTSIVGFSSGGDAMFLDPGRDPAQNAGLAATTPVVVTTSFGGVPVRFQLPHVVAASHEGRPAFFAPLPAMLHRVQRREAFRAGLSFARPPRCIVPEVHEEVTLRAEATIADISCGGVGLLEGRQPLGLLEGRLYEGCTLELPQIGAIVADLEVRNMHEMRLPGGPRRRFGCRFVGLSEALRARVNRLVMLLERDRRGR